MPKDSGFLRTVSKAESLGQISREWVQMSINQTRGNREWAMQLLQNPQSILSFFLSPSGILEYQSPDQHKEVCFQKKKKGEIQNSRLQKETEFTRQIFSKKLTCAAFAKG